MFERTIDTSLTGAITAAVEKVNRRAARLGAAAFTLTFGAPYIATVRINEVTRHIERVVATITGEPVVVPNFRFLGRVDFEDSLTLVNARPGEVIPPRYQQATTYCDHCASQRQRNAVFIFRRDGGEQHVQVGRTCLKDFIGHDAERVLNSATLSAMLADELDEAEQRGGGAVEFVGVEEGLTMAAAVIRQQQHGVFVSRAASEKTDGRVPSTSALVFEQLYPPKDRRHWVQVTPTDEDAARAAAAREWCLQTMGDDQNDYQHNLHQLMGVDMIRLRRLGLAVSLLGAHARHLGEQAAHAKLVNAHVGTVGKRQAFVARFAGASSFDTDYGTLYIGRFDTDAGRLVYKGGSPFWPASLREGDEVQFTATIKEHSDYKGFCQTIIQRAKLRVTEPA